MASDRYLGLEYWVPRNDCHVGAGPPGVEADQVPDALEISQIVAADHAGHRPRHHRLDRSTRQHDGAADAAVGLHHQGVAIRKPAGEQSFKVLEIARYWRADIGTGDRRCRAFVFPPLGIHLTRKSYVDVWGDTADDLCRLALVRRVGIGEQECDR